MPIASFREPVWVLTWRPCPPLPALLVVRHGHGRWRHALVTLASAVAV